MEKKSTEKKLLNVLCLEDSPRDTEIVRELLTEAGYDLRMDVTDKKKEFTTLLRSHLYNVILSDFSLPGFDAFGALELSKDICPEVPFICVSGSIGEEIAIELIKKGAVDYVLKDRMVKLPFVVNRALEEAKENERLRQVEEALRESEQRFQVLSQNAPVGIFQTDINGFILYVNPRYCQITGLSQEEAIGTGWLNTLHDDDKNKLTSAGKKVTHMHDFFQTEFRFVHKDGTIAWVIGQVIPQKNTENRIISYLGTITEITERKLAETALRESEERFSTIFHASPVGTVITRISDGKVNEVNSAVTAILGYSTAEMIGQTTHELGVWVDIEQRNIMLKMLQENGSVHNFETKCRRKSGEVGDLLVSAEIIELSGTKYMLSLFFDITQRKLAEEKAQNLMAIVESSTDAIIGKTLDGYIVSWNKGAEKIFGYTEDEVIGRSISMLAPSDSKDEIQQILQRIVRGERIEHFETVRQRKDGQLLSMSITVSPIKDAKGDIISASIIGRDITERKQIEEHMHQMQRLEGLGTLAGGIAHDFNNILGIILAYNTSIKQFKDDAKKLNLATETITKAVERGKTLVQQILTFARKTETEFARINVNDLVLEIMVMIFETFPKTLTYAQNINKGIKLINADRSQLYQVLLNLCVNARDAMPKGGLLTINTRLVPGQNIRKQYPDALENDYVCIEVVDTGEGMSNETKERLFEPFFTTKELGKGTGLGLAVVFGVIQTHKGFIDVESELGEGTTFRLYLPALEAADSIIEQAEETLEEMPGGTETLLIVEDEQMLLMSLTMILVEKGYKVISAVDGLEAVDIYKAQQKDIALVLTDLGLPKITGLEECALIREINPEARMIVATGYLDPEMKQEFTKVNVQHFIYKPYDIKQVLKIVRMVLDGK